MKTPYANGNASGFTLVEMLVVITIISLVAAASINAIRGAQRQAKASKCAANLHALHQAALSYKADTKFYPTASSYETYSIDANGTEHFAPHRGWISWVRTSATVSRRKSSGNLYPNDSSQSSSKASQYCYVGPGCGASDYNGAKGTAPNFSNVELSRVYRSIDEGSIFKYTDKNFSIYCCDEFKAKFGNHCMRSYAMNRVFGDRRSRPDVSSPGIGGTRQASRLAMFVELDESAGGSSGAVGAKTGTPGNAAPPTDTFKNDAIWDWDKGENIGAWHRKGGKLYGHVVFADGHLDSIIPSNTDDQRKELGGGIYGDGEVEED